MNVCDHLNFKGAWSSFSGIVPTIIVISVRVINIVVIVVVITRCCSSHSPHENRRLLHLISPVTKFPVCRPLSNFQFVARYKIPASTARYQITDYRPLPNYSLPPVTKLQLTARYQITAYLPLPNLRFLLLLQFLFLF